MCCQYSRLEALHVCGVDLLADAAGVPREVEDRRGQVLGRPEALAVGQRRLEPGHLSQRQRLAGQVVPGVTGQDVGVPGPHLVDLGGELDEVPRDRGAGEARVGHVREQAVQGVAELVERSVDLGRAEQRGLPVGRTGHVEADRDHGPVAQQAGLVDERGHPRTAALGVAGVEVGDEQADALVVVVVHLEDPDVRVVAGQVRSLGEPQAVELFGGVQHAVT